MFMQAGILLILHVARSALRTGYSSLPFHLFLYVAHQTQYYLAHIMRCRVYMQINYVYLSNLGTCVVTYAKEILFCYIVTFIECNCYGVMLLVYTIRLL